MQRESKSVRHPGSVGPLTATPFHTGMSEGVAQGRNLDIGRRIKKLKLKRQFTSAEDESHLSPQEQNDADAKQRAFRYRVVKSCFLKRKQNEVGRKIGRCGSWIELAG